MSGEGEDKEKKVTASPENEDAEPSSSHSDVFFETMHEDSGLHLPSIMKETPKPKVKAAGGEDAKKGGGHQRKVSWGGEGHQSLPAYLPPRTPPRSPPLTPPLSPPSISPKSSNLSLNDVIKANPLESEAETLILSVLERQEAVNRARAETGTNVGSSSAFPNVPDAALALFEDEALQDRRPSSVLTDDEQASVASTVASLHPPIPTHKRVQTMEQTLFGLTRAISGLQPASPAPKPNAGGGAADVLEQNAAKLQPDIKKPKNQWALVRNAVKFSSVSESNTNHSKIPENQEIADEDVVDVENAVPAAAPATGTDEEERNTLRFFGDAWRKAMATPVKESTGLASDLRTFVSQRTGELRAYFRLLLCIMIPATGVAAILFYLADNPPTGVFEKGVTSVIETIDVNDENTTSTVTIDNSQGKAIRPDKASASWWIIFVCVRQIIIFSAARLLQVVVIDFFCLSTRLAVKLFGQFVTLFIVQSKGWPFLITFWGIFGFALLSGDSEYARHWLYWQDYIGLFNEKNPSGSIPSSDAYHTVLAVAVSLGLIATAKRLALGFYLGQKTFNNYAEDLSKTMKKLVLLGKVGILARGFARDYFSRAKGQDGDAPPQLLEELGISPEKFEGLLQSAVDAEGASTQGDPSTRSLKSGGFIVDPEEKVSDSGGLSSSQRMRLEEILGRWEDPAKDQLMDGNVSISAILQLRASMAALESPFMFSIAWGDVSTRERMILSSQKVFKRINLRTPDTNKVRFDVLALAVLGADGVLNEEMLEDLIRLLRPDRDGFLSLLDFVKSVDAVYKEAKLLSASVHNNEKVDKAFERVFNVLFYSLTGIFILSQTGYDPLALFLSLSSVILAFAFMIGPASSNMFEGWLFILLRRPYDIGDRIHISNPEADTSPSGSAGWIVKDVTLFTTTVVFGTTNEVATVSNGSMSSSRIINMARSPQAVIHILLKFSTNVPYEKIQILEQAVRKFVMARPREWANFVGFRATQIQADLGFIEYIILIQHREAWQNISAVLTSKAEVASFCLEVSKKMDMRYQSPPMPIHLAIADSAKKLLTSDDVDSSSPRSRLESLDFSTAAALFAKDKVS